MKERQLCGRGVAPRETNGDLLILPSTVINQYRYSYYSFYCANIPLNTSSKFETNAVSINSSYSLVYHRSCCGGQHTGDHSHWWHRCVRQGKWFLPTWERVHLPGLLLWSAAPAFCRLQLEPGHRVVPTSKLLRPHRRSHSGDRARFATPNIWHLIWLIYRCDVRTKFNTCAFCLHNQKLKWK